MQKILINDELPAFVTVPEAAKHLGVGRKIIYQLLENNELRAVRERGKILIDPCSIKEFQKLGKMV